MTIYGQILENFDFLRTVLGRQNRTKIIKFRLKKAPILVRHFEDEFSLILAAFWKAFWMDFGCILGCTLREAEIVKMLKKLQFFVHFKDSKPSV